MPRVRPGRVRPARRGGRSSPRDTRLTSEMATRSMPTPHPVRRRAKRPPGHPGAAGPARHHAEHRPGPPRPGARPPPGRRRPRPGGPAGRNGWPPGRLPTGPGPGSRPSTPPRSSGPGRPPRPSPAALGLRVRVDRGLIECDFGEWTGEALKQLMKLPEWATVQRYPSGFRFPGGESFVGHAGPHGRHHGATCGAATPARPSWPCPTPIPIKAVVADALGTHLDLFQRIVISPCSVTAISYGPGGPDGAGGQLHRDRCPSWCPRERSA